MILETVYSLNNAPIRLTEERWRHILEAHPYMGRYYEDMLDAVNEPEYIFHGHRGSLIAVVTLSKKRILHVMYRELGREDGFIITAYVKTSLDKKNAIWPRD
ncbi:MAG TPA: hypothetical protein VGN90_03780 [Pyrinomonadaceae bacterium]|jgi:hypothetical protein|nr:hypothetical protein [Pyrinomonadaceae bacterium]